MSKNVKGRIGISSPFIGGYSEKQCSCLDSQKANLEALQFVSNVIELKPDKKYLMIFDGLNYHQLNAINDVLRARGFDCLCITTFEGQEVKVIEASAEDTSNRFEQAQQYTKAIKEIADSAFWQELGRAMSIRERRAIFAKLAEHLGLAVDEWGNTDDGIKKQFSLDEAKKILEPYKKIEDYLS